MCNKIHLDRPRNGNLRGKFPRASCQCTFTYSDARETWTITHVKHQICALFSSNEQLSHVNNSTSKWLHISQDSSFCLGETWKRIWIGCNQCFSKEPKLKLASTLKRETWEEFRTRLWSMDLKQMIHAEVFLWMNQVMIMSCHPKMPPRINPLLDCALCNYDTCRILNLDNIGYAERPQIATGGFKTCWAVPTPTTWESWLQTHVLYIQWDMTPAGWAGSRIHQSRFEIHSLTISLYSPSAYVIDLVSYCWHECMWTYTEKCCWHHTRNSWLYWFDHTHTLLCVRDACTLSIMIHLALCTGSAYDDCGVHDGQSSVFAWMRFAELNKHNHLTGLTQDSGLSLAPMRIQYLIRAFYVIAWKHAKCNVQHRRLKLHWLNSCWNN